MMVSAQSDRWGGSRAAAAGGREWLGRTPREREPSVDRLVWANRGELAGDRPGDSGR
jgi:hypothetical protein